MTEFPPPPDPTAAVLNPTQVRQREHIGISAMVFGALFLLIGVIALFISWPVATATLLLGLAGLVCGAFVLTRIPDLLHAPDEER